MHSCWQVLTCFLRGSSACIHVCTQSLFSKKSGQKWRLSLSFMDQLTTIIESVDSNVGIAWTCNIWQYKKISQNLKNGKLISLYNNVPFIVECFHDQQVSQWRKKASRKYQTRSSRNGRNVFLSSSDGLAHYCGQTAAVWWQAWAQACAEAAKNWHEQVIKNI